MVHDEKVIHMTKMQVYEDGKGKHDVAIANFFRGDYIGWQMLKGGICVTIAMILIYAGSIFYDLEGFMNSFYQLDLLAYVKDLVTKYVYILGGYIVITYVVYAYRYGRAKKNLKGYYGDLKKMNAYYKREVE